MVSGRIHFDFAGVGAMSSSLRGLRPGSADVAGLDLAALRSDLVTSAVRAFAAGWSDALFAFELTRAGLAGGVDATLNDFLAAEKATIDSITSSLSELDK